MSHRPPILCSPSFNLISMLILPNNSLTMPFGDINIGYFFRDFLAGVFMRVSRQERVLLVLHRLEWLRSTVIPPSGNRVLTWFSWLVGQFLWCGRRNRNFGLLCCLSISIKNHHTEPSKFVYRDLNSVKWLEVSQTTTTLWYSLIYQGEQGSLLP